MSASKYDFFFSNMYVFLNLYRYFTHIYIDIDQDIY